MKKLLLLSLCAIVSSCGTFGGSYTDPNGATFQASVKVPNKTTSDAK